MNGLEGLGLISAYVKDIDADNDDDLREESLIDSEDNNQDDEMIRKKVDQIMKSGQFDLYINCSLAILF